MSWGMPDHPVTGRSSLTDTILLGAARRKLHSEPTSRLIDRNVARYKHEDSAQPSRCPAR